MHEVAVVSSGWIRTRCGVVLPASTYDASAWHGEVDCPPCRDGQRCTCGHGATVHTLDLNQKKQCGAVEGCKCGGWET